MDEAATSMLALPPICARIAELGILESRDAWTRVALSDGTRGWVASSAIEAVDR